MHRFGESVVYKGIQCATTSLKNITQSKLYTIKIEVNNLQNHNAHQATHNFKLH